MSKGSPSSFLSFLGGKYPTLSLVNSDNNQDAIDRVGPKNLSRTVTDLVLGRPVQWCPPTIPEPEHMKASSKATRLFPSRMK